MFYGTGWIRNEVYLDQNDLINNNTYGFCNDVTTVNETNIQFEAQF